MNRTDAIVKIDEALDRLEEALEMLDLMGSSFSIHERLRIKIHSLTDFRVEIMSADLPLEVK